MRKRKVGTVREIKKRRKRRGEKRTNKKKSEREGETYLFVAEVMGEREGARENRGTNEKERTRRGLDLVFVLCLSCCHIFARFRVVGKRVGRYG